MNLPPLKTSWLTAGLLASLMGCAQQPVTEPEWESLFNGQDINQWTVKIHRHEVGENFAQTFRVEDGMIKVRYDGYGDFNDQFGHLYFNRPFSNFHLKLNYRFSGKFHPGAPAYAKLNSGVMFYSQSPQSMPKGQNWPISVEMQFLADLQDGNVRTTGNMCSPGTDIEFENEVFASHCLNSTLAARPAGEWVSAELIVKDGEVTQLINGMVVLQYANPTIGGMPKAVKGENPQRWQPGLALRTGYIALQSEGHPIEFRDIKIKQL